jgi:two-component system chemotaxis response regulator CheV
MSAPQHNNPDHDEDVVDAVTKHIPVVLFSSLVSDDNKKKGMQVGADVQIPKPELAQMVMLVDKVVSGEKVGVAQE